MPETFSERDMYRVLYPSRIKKVEVPDTSTGNNNPVTPLPLQTTPVVNVQGDNQAAKTPAAPIKTTGTSLSGKPVNSK